MQKIAVILFVLSLCAPNARGQADSITSGMMDTVKLKHTTGSVVTINDPGRIDTLSLKRMVSRNLSDLLGRTSGVFVKNYGPGNISAITMRGMSAAQTSVTWNGIELNSPMYGMTDLNLVPVAVFNQARLFPGEGAIGGNVDLITMQDNFSGLNLSAIQSVESFEGLYSQLSATYGRKNDSFSSYGSTKIYRRTAKNDFPYVNNARFGSPMETQNHAETEMYGIVQNVHQMLGKKTGLGAVAWAQHNYRNLPPPLTSANNRETQEDNSVRGALRLSKSANRGWLFISGNINREELIYANEVIGLNARSLSNTFNLWAGRSYHKNNSSYYMTLSGKYTTASEGRYFGIKEQNRIGGFFYADIPAFRKSHLVATIKPEVVNFSSVLPNVGVKLERPYYKSKRNIHLSLAANLDHKYPNLNDLYWNPGGNDSLKPERALKQELAIERVSKLSKGGGRFDFKLAAYSIYAFDFIQWQPADGAYWMAQNLNEVWSRGIEAFTKFRWHLRGGLLIWSSSYNYTRVSTQKPINPGDKSVGRQLIYVPRNTAQSSLQYEHKKFYAGAYYMLADYRRTPDGYLPPYQLIDLDMGTERKLKDFTASLSFRANNIRNESYQVIVWRPMPGRWYSLTLGITFEKSKKK